MRLSGVSRSAVVAVGVLAGLGGIQNAGAVTRYNIVELGSLYSSYGAKTVAYGINNAGQVVGSSKDVDDDPRPFLWQNGQMTELPTPDGPFKGGIAWAINDSGAVAGGATFSWEAAHPVTWSNGAMADLGTIAGAQGAAFAINNARQVVGQSNYDPAGGRYDKRVHAFLWSQGAMTDLGTLGGQDSIAYDINDRGQVVGWAATGSGGPTGVGARHAFLWQNGVMTDLTPGLAWGAEANAINTAGSIVGKGCLIEGSTAWYPLAWRAGSMAPLTLLSGTLEGWATDINDMEQIVGTLYLNAGRGDRAVLWDADKPYDLNSLVDFPAGSNWILRYAAGINNSAQIIASDYTGRQFLLTPVPEPSSMLLLSLVTAAVLRRRH